MSLTYSKMLPLGTRIPSFKLTNVMNNEIYSETNLSKNLGTVVMIICNHCPYVIHYHQQIRKLENDFNGALNFVAISSNDVKNYPQDGTEEMKLLWEKLKLSFPYLYDETQSIAKKYKAECTPEFYLFDISDKLVYRGRLDDTSPSSSKEPDGKDLRNAINCLIQDKAISAEQYPSMGCNIKWK